MWFILVHRQALLLSEEVIDFGGDGSSCRAGSVTIAIFLTPVGVFICSLATRERRDILRYLEGHWKGNSDQPNCGVYVAEAGGRPG